MQDTYNILAINADTGVVTLQMIYALADGSQHADTQDVAGLPMTNAQSLQQAISDYLVAYKAGKQVEVDNVQPKLNDSVQALIGQSQTVTPQADTPTA